MKYCQPNDRISLSISAFMKLCSNSNVPCLVNLALSTFTWTYPYFIFDSFQVNISHFHLSFKVRFSSNVDIWFQLHLNEQNLLLIILVLVNNNKTANTQVMPLFTEECLHIYGIYRLFLSLKEDVWSSFSFIMCRHTVDNAPLVCHRKYIKVIWVCNGTRLHSFNYFFKISLRHTFWKQVWNKFSRPVKWQINKSDYEEENYINRNIVDSII